ncbi:hypothetical protein FB45DRAFT_140365 [Roridomyces roridus]|uniref:Protein CPL1-like domain-containing protein n=1 Tax=Roridomyces roridus TaxID=1738132 RepID=A0AAD7BHX6_9AGAR|nr:hypothetical protein FB45DRAFT_140365 [Roridomyces roridus]
MLRQLLTVFTLIIYLEALVGVGASSNPCATGTLVPSKDNNSCECKRRTGIMGSFRSGCSARLSEGSCLVSCSTVESFQQIELAPEAMKACPAGTRACPVGRFDFECIMPGEDVDNCGGCVSTGEGEACGDYPGVRGAACVRGVCDVYSCHPGYTLVHGGCNRGGRKKERAHHTPTHRISA